MKKSNDQGVGATAFDHLNDQHPGYENKIYHTSHKVPRPHNEAAERANAAEIMRHVNEAK